MEWQTDTAVILSSTVTLRRIISHDIGTIRVKRLKTDILGVISLTTDIIGDDTIGVLLYFNKYVAHGKRQCSIFVPRNSELHVEEHYYHSFLTPEARKIQIMRKNSSFCVKTFQTACEPQIRSGSKTMGILYRSSRTEAGCWFLYCTYWHNLQYRWHPSFIWESIMELSFDAIYRWQVLT